MEARTQVKPGVLPTKPIRKGNDLGNFTSSRGSQSGQSVYSSGAVSIGKGDPQSQYVLPEQAAEIRDLKALIDNLRRELERKDSRNDKLSKDMVSLRTALANQEVGASIGLTEYTLMVTYKLLGFTKLILCQILLNNSILFDCRGK